MAAVDEVFKALGDPVRVKIVEMLAANGEMCVCKIMEQLGMTQPAVSHHLCTLKYSGLVYSRRDGQWIHYSLNQDTLGTAKAFLEDVLWKLDAAPTAKRVCSPERRERGSSKDAAAVTSGNRTRVS